MTFKHRKGRGVLVAAFVIGPDGGVISPERIRAAELGLDGDPLEPPDMSGGRGLAEKAAASTPLSAAPTTTPKATTTTVDDASDGGER